MKNRALIILLFFHSLCLVFGSELNYKLIKNLGQDIIVFDEEEQVFVPFISDLHSRVNTISVNLNKEMYSDCLLEIEATTPIGVFVNGKLCYDFSKPGLNRININELNGIGDIMISIYGLKRASSIKKLRVVYPFQMYLSSNQNINSIKPKPIDPYLDVIITTLLIILFGYAFIRIMKPKIYTWYFDITKLVSNTSTDTNIVVTSFNGSVFILLGLNALVLSFCLNLFSYHRVVDNMRIEVIGNEFIGSLLLIAIVIYIGFLLKFFLLKFVGGLIGMHSLSKLHYFEFNRLVTLISCFALPMSLLAFYSGANFGKATQLLFIFLFLIATLRIILVVNRVSTFRIIYLFSYICTTEIVPILILAKYFGFEHL